MLSVNNSRSISEYFPALPERTARQVRIEASQQSHHFPGLLAQVPQPVALLVGLIELLVGAQRVFDFVVVGEITGVGSARLPRRLALGQRVVVDAVNGHQPRRQMGNAFPHLPVVAVVSRHLGQYNWSFTSSGGLGESPPSLSGPPSCSGGMFS
jgi:hypothetical protein